MKAILMSIKPKYVAKILNGEKTIEIRKTMPKCDLPIDVYIYCTRQNDYHEICIYDNPIDHKIACSRYHVLDHEEETLLYNFKPRYFKGLVVAKFTLNKVEEIEKSKYNLCYTGKSLTEMNLLKYSCLTFWELHDYLKSKNGYAWQIDNLKVFDFPRELRDFSRVLGTYECNHNCEYCDMAAYSEKLKRFIHECEILKAPQSWCYIEV